MLDVQSIIKNTFPLKLLYVEDDKDARVAILSILEEFFDLIIVAHDGLDGLESFDKNKFDLIITDVNMPRMNGLEMIKEIRRIDEHIPILVLSAYNETDYFMESIKVGVDGYLLKPIELNQFLGMLQKVTQKLTLKSEAEKNLHFLHQYQEATDKSSIISKINLDGQFTYINDEFCDISGYSREELLGKTYDILNHPDMPESTTLSMWQAIKIEQTTWSGMLRNISKNGDSYYVRATIKPIFDQKGEVVEFISLRDDITDIMNPMNQLHDLIDSYDKTIVALIKIERFEYIEKYYGSKLSYKIENEFSKIISSLIPNSCTFEKVFTLGNGEYILAKDKQGVDINSAIRNLKELQSIINDTKLDIGELDYDISILISFAYGKDSLNNAKYGLKKILETKQDFIIANNLAHKEYEDAQKNLETLKMIKRAIDNYKIISYFQPIINNKTMQIEKYESLVRLIDIDDNVLSPFHFLDTAKEAKYYSLITTIVLQNSFNALKQTDMDITINISILDIEKSSIRDKIYELLEQNKDNLHRIIFELLEDENVKDFDTISSFINEVKKQGVRIAIDDFGAGYSNYERLLHYQPDILKIDGSLIKNIEHDKYSLHVVESIVSFAKKQNLETVAEFVENENIFNILKELGVDYSQGYYFGKPKLLNSL